MMFLIDNNGRWPLCRECRKVHSAQDCPVVKAARQRVRTLRVMAAIRAAKAVVGQ
jgi:hypothetical protein